MGWREPVDNLKTYPIGRCSTDLAGQHDEVGTQDARSPSPVVADQRSIGLPRRAATYVHVAQQRRIGARERLSPYVVEPAEDSRPTHIVRRHQRAAIAASHATNQSIATPCPNRRATADRHPQGATPQSYVGTMQLGQHAPASLMSSPTSATRISARARATVYSNTDPAAYLKATMQRLAIVRPDAIVFTGDIADLGEPEAYEAVASIVVDAAAEMGSELIWVMGNHDAREPFSRSPARTRGRSGCAHRPGLRHQRTANHRTRHHDPGLSRRRADAGPA